MPQVVVITGMHRSGTSLAASLLQRAGVDVGERLLDPSRANPRGFFEDVDFVAFHDRALRDRGRTILTHESFAFEPSQAENERADQVVAAREGRSLWGWKDPRTSLFLEFWDARLDGAVSYLFLFRHPLDVLLSFLRRHDYEAVGLAEAVGAWELYYGCILQFREQRRERCALVHAHGAPVLLDRFNEALRDKLRLDISVTPEMVAQLYHPAELHESDDWAKASFALIEPTAAQIYEDLVRAADVPPPESASPDEPRELATFRTFANELLPELGSRRRGLLLTLVELVSPDVVEKMFGETRRHIRDQAEWISELEVAKEWLDEQRLGWMRRVEDLERYRLRSLIRRLLARIRRGGGGN